MASSLLHVSNCSFLTPRRRVCFDSTLPLKFLSKDIFVTSSVGLRGSTFWSMVEGGAGERIHSHVHALNEKQEGRNFKGTPYIPVYVMLPLELMNMECDLVDSDSLKEQLKRLKEEANVDGVVVDCWWGIVEAHTPQQYNWKGYKELFQIVQDLNLKLQVVMSFHECGGNVGDTLHIPLPKWVKEIGEKNPDIYFTDRKGIRNQECLTWGIDNERVLRGRTAIEVYYDYMKSFKQEFDELFENGVISEIQIGLGPCGELRYPSYPEKNGWKYPGIGDFQCFDKYLTQSLEIEAETKGNKFIWGKGPKESHYSNSNPHKIGYYDIFFLNWYSKILMEHGRNLLEVAKYVFEDTSIVSKLSGATCYYKTDTHSVELTAGYYNISESNGYTQISAMLKELNSKLSFSCVEFRIAGQMKNFQQNLKDPNALVWKVLKHAWQIDLPVETWNSLPCYSREDYNKMLEIAKPVNNPDNKHLSAFTYLRLNPVLMQHFNFLEFKHFVTRMHGEAV